MLLNVEMASLDLEDAYLSLPIHPSTGNISDSSDRKLSMSLRPCHLALLRSHIFFTKILRLVVAHLRAEGLSRYYIWMISSY